MEPKVDPVESNDGTPAGANFIGRGVGDGDGNVVGLGVA